MKYDFTSIIDRVGKDALAIECLGKMPSYSPDKPDEGYDIIPMWISDMNFPTCPTIQSTIIERVNHPFFGYFSPREEYYNSIIEWQKKRNGVNDLKKENIGYENGVLGGVISALNIFCSRGDKILVHSPIYIGYKKIFENNGYNIVTSELKKDEKGIFRMDYEDMEKKIKDQKIHTVIFCSPQNPMGRVWEKEEILKAMEIFEKYNVYIISDEVWSDIILFENKHIPTQSVNDYAKNHTIAFYSPSKAFNLSGLIGAYHIIYSQYIKDRLEKESSLSHYNNMSIISMYSLIGAYKPEAYDWLEQLLKVLAQNVEYATNYIRGNFKGISLTAPEGTYFLFIDCFEWCKENNKTIEEVEKAAWKVGVALQDGKMFNGNFHLRINLALPLSRVKEAFDRLNKYVFNKK